MAKASENSFIVVNGEKMTIKAWKQMVADKQKDRRGKKRFLKNDKPKKVEKKEKEISIVAAEVEKMMKPITALKSFAAYYDHAYRQWGTIANNILQHRKIRPHFVFYRVSVGELERLIEDIEKMAKGNEKAAYQYVEKTAWKLEDIKTHIQNIIKGAVESGYMEAYKHEECINGKGRRLGLQTLANKSLKAISQLEDVIGTLKKIADNGTDPFEVGTHMTAKSRARCWA
jgi:hypothetical protein